MMNQVLEATLAFMVLLLALSVTAIVRVGPMAQAQTESNVDGEMASAGPAPMPVGMPAGPLGMPAGPAGMTNGVHPGRAVQAAPPPVTWTSPGPGGFGPTVAGPAVRRPGLLGRGRYEARHVRGRIPKPRPPAPAGPPWGPAAPPPPGRPQQSSERLT